MTDTPMFSRSSNTNALGKCTEEIKTLVPEETKTAIAALAYASSMNVSEYVRTVLMMHVHGAAEVLRQNNRIIRPMAED